MGRTLDTTIRISNFENNHAWFRRMLHGVQKLVYGRILEIVVQVQTLSLMIITNCRKHQHTLIHYTGVCRWTPGLELRSWCVRV